MVNFEDSEPAFLPKHLDELFDMLIPKFLIAAKLRTAEAHKNLYAFTPVQDMSRILGREETRALTNDVLNHHGSKLPADVAIGRRSLLSRISSRHLLVNYFTNQMREAGAQAIAIDNRINVEVPEGETKLKLLLDAAVARSPVEGRGPSLPRRP